MLKELYGIGKTLKNSYDESTKKSVTKKKVTAKKGSTYSEKPKGDVMLGSGGARNVAKSKRTRNQRLEESLGAARSARTGRQ